MSNFVCSGAKWRCNFGGCGVLEGTSDVMIQDKSILTEKDKPSPIATGVCSALSGAPCSPKTLMWQNVSKTVYGNKHSALLSKSYIKCLVGGTITINSYQNRFQKMLEKRAKHKKTKNNYHTSPPKKPPDSKAYKFYLTTSNSNIKKHLSQSIKNDTKIFDTLVKSTTPETDIQNKLPKPPEQVLSSTPTPKLLRKKHWCSGDCPEEYKNACRFCIAPSQLRYENKGSALKENLQKEHIYTAAINISKTQFFSLAHHHLIPGNECYGRKDGINFRYELLVKLGYFFDYNINASQNGILLPTVTNIPEANQSQDNGNTKAAYYYAIMDKDIRNNPLFMDFSADERGFIGSQLHQGPHTYETNLRALRKIHPEAYKLRSYENIVISELDQLNNFYMDLYENICFMKDYEKTKKEFFARMNTISKRLRERINRFPEPNKKLSFLNKKVYVSFPAILYDMKISLEEYQENYLN